MVIPSDRFSNLGCCHVRDRFFYPILTRLMDSFSCSPFNTSFFLLKKGFPEVPEYAEM